jgi:hypothetical protein
MSYVVVQLYRPAALPLPKQQQSICVHRTFCVRGPPNGIPFRRSRQLHASPPSTACSVTANVTEGHEVRDIVSELRAHDSRAERRRDFRSWRYAAGRPVMTFDMRQD